MSNPICSMVKVPNVSMANPFFSKFHSLFQASTNSGFAVNKRNLPDLWQFYIGGSKHSMLWGNHQAFYEEFAEFEDVWVNKLRSLASQSSVKTCYD